MTEPETPVTEAGKALLEYLVSGHAVAGQIDADTLIDIERRAILKIEKEARTEPSDTYLVGTCPQCGALIRAQRKAQALQAGVAASMSAAAINLR